MKKIFKINSLSPFDLMRWSKDVFYDVISEEYNKKFNINIEILEANTKFIKDGLKIEIFAFRSK